MGNIEPLTDHSMHKCDGLILFPFGGGLNTFEPGSPWMPHARLENSTHCILYREFAMLAADQCQAGRRPAGYSG